MSAIAYVTVAGNPLGADPGVSIFRGPDEIARHDTDLRLEDKDGGLHEDAADVFVARFGYDRTGPWIRSGGQWAAEVESFDSLA